MVLSRRPLVGRSRLTRLRLSRNRATHLKLTLTLPGSSTPTLAGQTTRVVYAFAGVRARRP